ncbi:MAG: 6-phosphofructokinase [Clostridia bacterium]|nr:6-phosphofructokinase [Clostridia bacterium]
MKTIGVLTSGGDAPGMNAAVRAVVRTAVYNGIKVKGIRRGYNGLMEGDIIDLDSRAVSGIIQLGGTMLYSARSPRFKTQEGVAEAVENCKKHGIEGIVVIGGDGSFRGARDLSLAGIPCVGVPATIDNDITSTEYTIGFDTAMNTVIQMVDRLRDTCDSHERCSVVEVMGRHAGHLALRTAIGVGALAVLVPERENDLNAVIEKIKETQRMGKKHFIVMVAEGVGGVTEMAEKIEAATGIETRGTILGHVQRGGSPTLRDRLIATQMGFAAVQLLKEGIGNRVVAYKLGEVVNYDIYEALNMTKGLEDNLCTLADITAI